MNRKERAAKAEAEAFSETYEKARAMYLTLVGLTEGPQEGMSMLCIMHLLMFINHGLNGVDVNEMLRQYCENFKQNYEKQMEATAVEQGKLN